MNILCAVFDTNILIDYLNGIPQAKQTLDKYNNKPAISVITWMEVVIGAKKFSADQEPKMRNFLPQFLRFSVNDTVSEYVALIWYEQKIKLPDAIILATEQVNNRLLISRNPGDFNQRDGVIMPRILSVDE